MADDDLRGPMQEVKDVRSVVLRETTNVVLHHLNPSSGGGLGAALHVTEFERAPSDPPSNSPPRRGSTLGALFVATIQPPTAEPNCAVVRLRPGNPRDSTRMGATIGCA